LKRTAAEDDDRCAGGEDCSGGEAVAKSIGRGCETAGGEFVAAEIEIASRGIDEFDELIVR
jgi:hypothetical protein